MENLSYVLDFVKSTFNVSRKRILAVSCLQNSRLFKGLYLDVFRAF